ncbi:MAG: hypothetical protein EOM55_02570 [Clostridia bacterium]|nr:hypothetical protein [Clostridia bacterium]
MDKYDVEKEILKIINSYKNICLEKCNPFIKKQISDTLEYMKDFVRGWFSADEIRQISKKDITVIKFPD